MKTVLNVKVDYEIKKRAQSAAKKLHVPLSMLVNSYLREFAMKPIFHVELPAEKITKKLERAIASMEKDTKLNRNFVGPFNTGKDAADYLRSL